MTVAEMELGFQKIWELFAATDRQMKETDRQMKETDRELRAMFAETNLKFDREFEKLNHLFQRTDEKISALDSKWGRFVEGLVMPGVKRLFRERGIVLNKVSPRMNAQKNGDHLEIDVFGVGDEHVVMVEVKSTLSVDDVKEHLDALSRFKTFFPEYAERKLIGAVAGIVIDDNVSRYAYQQGLFVIGQSGDAVRFLNDDKFRPKAW